MRRVIAPEACEPTFNLCSDESGRHYCWSGFRGFESGGAEGLAPTSGNGLVPPTAFESSGTPAHRGVFSWRMGVALPAGEGLRTGFFVALCELGGAVGNLAGQSVSFSVFPDALLGRDTAPLPAGTFVEVLRVYAGDRPAGLTGQSEPLTSGIWNDVFVVVPDDPLDEALVGFEVRVVFGTTPYTGELFFDDLLLAGY
jgi:hypothetical protein